MKPFMSILNRGFQLTFANGWTISVQFASFNYCSNRDINSNVAFKSEMEQDVTESETAEIAIWDRNNKWHRFHDDTVKGWVTADEVAEWIARIVSWPDMCGHSAETLHCSICGR